MNQEITRDQLAALLQSQIAEKQTSTLYVHTDDNHLIAVGMEHGEIVSLTCGAKRGKRAIPLIQKMHSGTYRFDENVMPDRHATTELPTGNELLASLAGDVVEEDKPCDPDQLQATLCKVLQDHMGPMAAVVCKETIEAAGGLDSLDKIKRVIDDLAREIDDPGEANQFQVHALTELKNLLA
jgi:hypothetical protein